MSNDTSPTPYSLPRRPLLAALAAGVLFAMVFALWPRRAVPPPPGTQPRAAQPAAAMPATALAPPQYALATAALPKGARVRQEQVSESESVGHLSADGRVTPTSMSMKSQEVWDRETVEADEAGPLKLRLTCLTASETGTVTAGGPAAPYKNSRPLHGRVVVAERVDGRWGVTLEGAPPTPDQQRKLDQMYFGTDDPYPAEEVPVGHTGEVEGPALRTLLEEREATSLAGRVRMKFERVTSHKGEQCAELSLVGDVTGTGTNRQGDRLSYRMGVQGRVLRSLRDRLDVDVEITGTFEASGQGVRQTTTWLGARRGQAAEVKFAGPFKQSRTQKLTPPTAE